MPRTAKIYIALIISSGAAVLLLAAGSWSSSSLRQLAIFLGLAAVSSVLKVRIPGIEGTMSPNFVFLVLGMTICSFSEVTAIALTAALVQSLWRAKHPRLLQVTFSAAALVLSAALARQFSYLSMGRSSPVAFVILAGVVYLCLNTALVSGVIGLVEGKPFEEVLGICFEGVFPYFLGGVLFAGLISNSLAGAALRNGAVVLFPIVFLGYVYARRRNVLVATARSQPVPVPEEELQEV